MVTDNRHATRDGNARKTATIAECLFSNAGYTAGKRDARKSGAIFECILTNARHTIRYGNACKTGAIWNA